jgi:hypothetical protein
MTKRLNFDVVVANTFKDNHKLSHVVANRVMTFSLISTSDIKKLGNNKAWKKKSLASYSLTKCLLNSSSLNF